MCTLTPPGLVLLALCILIRASEPKSENIKVGKKWGFRQFQKEHQKVCKTALFALFLCKKCGFAHFLVLFLKLAETPLFVHFNVLAFWALRLESKYTILDLSRVGRAPNKNSAKGLETSVTSYA